MYDIIRNSFELKVFTDQTPEEFVREWCSPIKLLGGQYELSEVDADTVIGLCTIDEGNVAEIICTQYYPEKTPPQFRYDYSRFGISEINMRCLLDRKESVVLRLMIEWLNRNTCDAVYEQHYNITFIQSNGKLVALKGFVRMSDPTGEYMKRPYTEEEDLSIYEV